MSQFEIISPASVRVWPGLGPWNLYFILKFVLLWAGYLNLQVLPNLVFAAALLLPLPHRYLRILRTVIAIPVGVALFYQDTWLPPFSRLLSQPGVLDFSGAYMVELMGRFIDWNLCALLALLVVVYAFVRHWLRLTTLSVLGLAWLASANVLALSPSNEPVAAAASGAPIAAVSSAPRTARHWKPTCRSSIAPRLDGRWSSSLRHLQRSPSTCC